MLQTSGTLNDGAGNGDITVNAPIQMTGNGAAGLTLKAGGSIIINQAISSTGGALAVTLDADILGGGGYVNVAAPITTNGGNLVIGGGATPLTLPAVGTLNQPAGVYIGAAVNTGGGAITINGSGNNGDGVDIDANVSAGSARLPLSAREMAILATKLPEVPEL